MRHSCSRLVQASHAPVSQGIGSQRKLASPLRVQPPAPRQAAGQCQARLGSTANCSPEHVLAFCVDPRSEVSSQFCSSSACMQADGWRWRLVPAPGKEPHQEEAHENATADARLLIRERPARREHRRPHPEGGRRACCWQGDVTERQGLDTEPGATAGRPQALRCGGGCLVFGPDLGVVRAHSLVLLGLSLDM